jgi:transposase
MSSGSSARELKRFQVGGLPLIHAIARKIRLGEILTEFISPSGREEIPAAAVLYLLTVNLTLAKDPFYELGQWVDSLDLRALGYPSRPAIRLTDDRFARALDKLYRADRSSLLTRLVVAAVQAFEVQIPRVHNDSTTLKTYGQIPGQTESGLEMRRGHSKDHRPDLKQLVYTLSVSSDGAVPVHHHIYPGNRNDETTHIASWEALCRIHGRADFLYVADCKLCTQEQLAHIVAQGGRAITILPHNLVEVRRFLDQLATAPIPKHLLWRLSKGQDGEASQSYFLFEGQYAFDHGGYPLYWYYSTRKQKRDQQSRQERIEVARTELAALATKLNRAHLKQKPDILRRAQAILDHYQVRRFIHLEVKAHVQHLPRRRWRRTPLRGTYQYECVTTYSLHYENNEPALEAQARQDGVFPLLCTDPKIGPKEVLEAYKFQPRLEKRFCQLKSVHQAAPLLFKKIRRIEANLFVFFMALLIQALLERLIRQRIAQRKSAPLKLYPEDRDAPHPTTSQVFKTFDGLYSYMLTENGHSMEQFRDPLNDTQRAVLALLDMSEQEFWNPIF